MATLLEELKQERVYESTSHRLLLCGEYPVFQMAAVKLRRP